jgi:hypothetical protein
MRTLDEIKRLYPPISAEEVPEDGGYYFLLPDGTLIGASRDNEILNHAALIDCAEGSFGVTKFCEQYNVVRFINFNSNIYIDVDRPPLTQAQCEAIRTIFKTVGAPTMTWHAFPKGKAKDYEDTLAKFFVMIRKLRPGIDEWKTVSVSKTKENQ